MAFDWMSRTFPAAAPAQHTFHNGATGGIQSQYMTSCLKWHLPDSVDLVIVRYKPETLMPNMLTDRLHSMAVSYHCRSRVPAFGNAVRALHCCRTIRLNRCNSQVYHHADPLSTLPSLG
jgi:hypothetical protein